jgi:hypothetical protein
VHAAARERGCHSIVIAKSADPYDCAVARRTIMNQPGRVTTITN